LQAIAMADKATSQASKLAIQRIQSR
jgi:hypothetical protein